MEMVPRVESWFGHLDRIDARRIVISWNAQAKIVAIMSHEFVWTAHSIIAISVNMLKVELDSETFDARRFRGLNHIPISLQKVHRSDHARRIHFYAQCCLCCMQLQLPWHKSSAVDSFELQVSSRSEGRTGLTSHL